MAKRAQSRPASTAEILRVLEEVRSGPESQNGQAEEHHGLLEFPSTLSDARSKIRASINRAINDIFDSRKGAPQVVRDFMAQEASNGVLQNREQAEQLNAAVQKTVLQIIKRQSKRYSPFITATKEGFLRFQSYLLGLEFSSQEDEEANNDWGDLAGQLGSPGGGTGSESGAPDSKPEEEDLWHDPEMRELIVGESLRHVLQPALISLKENLQASSDPVIGESEAMDVTNFEICNTFVEHAKDALAAAVEESRTNDDLTAIQNKFTRMLAKRLANLEKSMERKRPHAGLLSALRACAATMKQAAVDLTQESMQAQQEDENGNKQAVSLDARALLLPETDSFLKRRKEKSTEWQWTDKDLSIFRKSITQTNGSKAFAEPTDSQLVSAVKIINDTVHAGLKDEDGESVILLSDAKSQVGYLRTLHEQRQHVEALSSVRQHMNDIYAESVLRSLLKEVRRAVEEKNQYHELPSSDLVYLVGEEDFQISWIPQLRNTVGSSLDKLIGDPSELQASLLLHGKEQMQQTLQHVCAAAAKALKIKNLPVTDAPDIDALATIIENPTSVHPYQTTINFEDHVTSTLLINRKAEEDFPLLDEEKNILRKAIENFFRGNTVALRRTYAALLQTLQKKDGAVGVAARQCNDRFHAGSDFRTPDGPLAEVAMELLQEQPYTQEPTQRERAIALEIVSQDRSNNRNTSTKVWTAINDRLYEGAERRSKAFVKGLTETVYQEWRSAQPAGNDSSTQGDGAAHGEQPSGHEAKQGTEEEQAPDAPPVDTFTTEEPESSGSSKEEESAQTFDSAPEETAARWLEIQQVHRAKAKSILTNRPDAEKVAQLKEKFNNTANAVRRAHDRAAKTCEALEQQATTIIRTGRNQKRATVIDEQFAPNFTLLHQFVNTLQEHETAHETLSRASSECVEYQQTIEGYQKHCETTQKYLSETLPVITAGQSPIELGIVDADDLARNGIDEILQDLYELKRELPSVYELCGTGDHEYKDRELRSGYKNEIEEALQAMTDLFQNLTGTSFPLPPAAQDLLIAAEEDGEGEAEGPDEDSSSDAGTEPSFTQQDSPDASGQTEGQEGDEENVIVEKLETLNDDERKLAMHCLSALCAPEFAGNTGTGFRIRSLRSCLEALFPDLELPDKKDKDRDDPLFKMLQRVSFEDATVTRALREIERGKNKKELTNGSVRVNPESLDAPYPFVLSLNNHRNFVFTGTSRGSEYLSEVGSHLTVEQIEQYALFREQERRKFRRIKNFKDQ